jgi:hypothetical protein
MEDRHPGWPRIWILESRAGGWSRAKGNKPSPTWQRDRQIWEGNLPKGGWRGQRAAAVRWKKLRRDLSEPRRNASDYEAAKTSKVRLLVNEWWMYSQPGMLLIDRVRDSSSAQ